MSYLSYKFYNLLKILYQHLLLPYSIYIIEMTFSFNLMNQLLLVSKFSSESFSSLSVFKELKRVRALLRIDFDLRKCCGWFDLPSRLQNFLYISNKAVSFVIICMFTGVALLSYWSSPSKFLQELSLCNHNLANCMAPEA